MIGAVLAGGRGERLGGAKARRMCAGTPLVAWPVAALSAVLREVVVVAKPDTELPALDVPVLREPAEPAHPLVGIVHAMEHAAGRPTFVVGADLPLLQPGHLDVLIRMRDRWGGSVVATDTKSLQPLCAIYDPAALDVFRSAQPDARLVDVVTSLDPGRVAIGDGALLNVNTSTDLRKAERALRRR